MQAHRAACCELALVLLHSDYGIERSLGRGHSEPQQLEQACVVSGGDSTLGEVQRALGHLWVQRANTPRALQPSRQPESYSPYSPVTH